MVCDFWTIAFCFEMNKILLKLASPMLTPKTTKPRHFTGFIDEQVLVQCVQKCMVTIICLLYIANP